MPVLPSFPNLLNQLERKKASIWPLSSSLNENLGAFSIASAEALPQFLKEQGLDLQLLNQVHGTDCATCYTQVPISADAWVWQSNTNQIDKQGIAGYSAFGIYTADCVPGLLRIYAGRTIEGGALMHLGRRGIEQRLLGKCFRVLVKNMATTDSAARIEGRKLQVQLVLGPSIGPCCYEVPRTLAKEFCRRANVSALCRKPHPEERKRAGHQMLDLTLAIREQALALPKMLEDRLFTNNIQINVETTGPCTSCQAQRYQNDPEREAVCYSYRRGHKKERIYTFVILPAPKPAQ